MESRTFTTVFVSTQHKLGAEFEPPAAKGENAWSLVNALVIDGKVTCIWSTSYLVEESAPAT